MVTVRRNDIETPYRSVDGYLCPSTELFENDKNKTALEPRVRGNALIIIVRNSAEPLNLAHVVHTPRDFDANESSY